MLESELSGTEVRISPYPFFVPPEDLASIRREAWTPTQAQAYSSWFHSVKDQRIAGLLAYFGENGSDLSDALIVDLGEHLKQALTQKQFSSPSPAGPVLTNQGYAVAADMGLLGAKLLCSRYPHLRWTIVRRPKSDISFNFPVLEGFGKVPLDPILVSLSQANGILAGHRGADAWLKVWRYWAHEADEKGASRST